MPKTLRYIGAEERFFEVGVTGSQQMWRRWQSGPVPDENVESLLKTGLFEVFEQNQVFESGGELFSSDGRSVGRGGALQTVRSDASWYDTGGSGGPIWVYENERTLYQHADAGEVNANVFIDPVDGNDANPGTRAQPKKTLNTATWTGSVTSFPSYFRALFKRGTTYTHSTGQHIELGSNKHIGAYGDPSIPRPVIQSDHTNDTYPFIILANAGDNISVSDVDINAGLQSNRSGIAATNGTREGDMKSHVYQNMRITGVSSTLSGTYPNITATLRCGIRFQGNGQTASRTSAYNTLYDIEVINVDVDGAGAGGFHAAGVVGKVVNGVLRGIRYRGCKVNDIGYQADALGFSSFAMQTLRDRYPTFTLVSGTRYYFQTNTAAVFGDGLSVPDVEMMYIRAGAVRFVRKNSATPTAPAVGEFGFDVATQRVYVDVGVALPTSSNTTVYVDLCTYATKGIIYDRCQAKGVRWPGTTSVHEGHGFAFDDFTSDCMVINSESINNEGMGISFNRGVRNWAINNRLTGNKFGAMGGLTLGARVWGNWVDENSRAAISGSNSVVAFVPPVYAFQDMPNRIGGFRMLRYSGSDQTGYLVCGPENFEAPANIFDNSVVDPGVGLVSGGGVGDGGFVLARGLLTPAEAWRLQLSPNFSGF